MKLFALNVNVFRANAFLSGKSCSPIATENYLFSTFEDCKKQAMTIDADGDIYNVATVYEGTISESEIVEILDLEDFAEFAEMLETPYSKEMFCKNYGEDEKAMIADEIIHNTEGEEEIECSNYDFDKSLEGAILVFWSWEKYIGYARKFIGIRRATSSDTEELITKEDRVFVSQCDVLLTAEEVEEAGESLGEVIAEELISNSWKWTNPREAEREAERAAENF